MNEQLTIRPLAPSDPEIIARAFTKIGWNKPCAQYEAYLEEQNRGTRAIFVAVVTDDFAGYLTILWKPQYAPFHKAAVPEIQDLNVLPSFRKRGIATALLNHAENIISYRSQIVGIGVGMYPDYGNAQRLYVKRGYIPDGRGLTHNGRILKPMEETVVDDDLVLYFTKSLTQDTQEALGQ